MEAERTIPGSFRARLGSGTARAVLAEWLALVDVRLDGDRPWDLRLISPDVPQRVLAGGTIALGESYMAGEWQAERLDQFFERVIGGRLAEHIAPLAAIRHSLLARLFNHQTRRRAWRVGLQHYNLGNDFFAAMLDRHMTYTCAYWQDAADLDAAQENKLALVCRKLGLQPGMRVLDIGCGWGAFMKYAAEHHGATCVGVTISAEQAALGRQRCAGLPVEFRLQDYRTVEGHYDRIVSLGMFEHVGHKNYRTYMDVAQRCLAEDGLFLLHTIGRNDTAHGTDAWIDRYIFPNGELPSIARIGRACEPYFVVEDLHNFGADYDPTLMAWHRNFTAAWPRFAERLGEPFRRMWDYYLLSCAGAFRARDIQLWQWIFSKRGVRGGYRRLN